MKPRIEDILQLSVPERLQLVQAIWESIARDTDALPLTDAHRRELDRRLIEYERNPSDTLSWDEIRKDLGQTG
jgi:putative addiction module component (TIGR02574 family)